MQTTDPTVDTSGMVPRVVNRTDALQVARLLSAQRGHTTVHSLEAKVCPHLWAEFLMTDDEAVAVARQGIIVRRV
jgi:hypothetical protein